MIITDTYVYFWRGPFSNWHRKAGLIKDPIDNTLLFHSTEQQFMWLKALFFNDTRVAALCEKEADCGLVKKLGREINGYDDKAWECVRLGYMTYVNYLKFSQNDDLRKILLDTGDRILVEASPYDTIWGIGVGEEEAAAGAEWKGRNLLGVALMRVRKLISTPASPLVPPTAI